MGIRLLSKRDMDIHIVLRDIHVVLRERETMKKGIKIERVGHLVVNTKQVKIDRPPSYILCVVCIVLLL